MKNIYYRLFTLLFLKYRNIILIFICLNILYSFLISCERVNPKYTQLTLKTSHFIIENLYNDTVDVFFENKYFIKRGYIHPFIRNNTISCDLNLLDSLNFNTGYFPRYIEVNGEYRDLITHRSYEHNLNGCLIYFSFIYVVIKDTVYLYDMDIVKNGEMHIM